MALIATEAYRVITDSTFELMRSIVRAAPPGDVTLYHAGLVGGELLGIYRAWSITGGALVGCGDEVFVADAARLLRLTKGEV